jgi:hypothetical protein
MKKRLKSLSKIRVKREVEGVDIKRQSMTIESPRDKKYIPLNNIGSNNKQGVPVASAEVVKNERNGGMSSINHSHYYSSAGPLLQDGVSPML